MVRVLLPLTLLTLVLAGCLDVASLSETRFACMDDEECDPGKQCVLFAGKDYGQCVERLDDVTVDADVRVDDTDPTDAGSPDTAPDSSQTDTGAVDTTSDSGGQDTSLADTSTQDSAADTASADTQAQDTGGDTLASDTSSDTSTQDTSVADTAADTSGGTHTPPIARFTIRPPLGDTSTTLTFDASASTDLESALGALTFDWDWNQDGVYDASGVTTTHSFSATGLMPVTLRVSDPDGLAGYVVHEATVVPTNTAIVVTTALDEGDGGATPSAPGGTGLSLREALVYASSLTDAATVYVSPGMSLVATDTMPNFGNPGGVTIVGYGATLDCSGLGNQDCMYLTSGHNTILGLEFFGSPERALYVSTATGDLRIADCTFRGNGAGADAALWLDCDGCAIGPGNSFVDNLSAGVLAAGSSLEFVDNLFAGNGDFGITFGKVDGANIVGNTFANNLGGVIYYSGGTGHRMVHNTFVQNTTNGVQIPNNDVGVDLRNNIFVGQAGSAVFARDSVFAFVEYNAFFGNAQDCAACTLPASNMVVDPLFIAAPDDCRLWPDSPVIDQAIDLGEDRNGPAPGTIYGSGPDIGAYEVP